MSASWASEVDGWADEEVESHDYSENEPQSHLSASQVGRLREAIDDENRVWSSPESARQASRTLVGNSINNNNIPRGGIQQQSAASGGSSSPRRRTTAVRPAQQSDESDFIMPSVTSLSSSGNARAKRPSTSQQLPRQRTNRNQRDESATDARGSRASVREAAGLKTVSRSDETTNYPALLWSHILQPTLRYAFEVLAVAFGLAKPLITLAFAIYLIVGGLILLRNFATQSINTALSPICRIPGTGYLNLPFCERFQHDLPTAPAEFDKLVAAQSAIDEVLTASVGEGSLPLAMKHSESSIRDLRTVVEHSKLPSRNELVFEFTGFIDTAKQASQDLSRYNTRIGRSVDKILTTNRWTIQVIEGIADNEAHVGLIPRLLNSVNIFSPFLPPQQMTQELLLDQYLRHTITIQDEVSALISEAMALLHVLDNLENRLQGIGDIAIRDGAKIQDDKDELFANLWTWLGGNQKSVARVNDKLRLLKDVHTYRKLATAHVMDTVVKLQAIESNLEDLRDRVAQPEVLGTGAEGMPLEMHIRHIQLGVERLEEIRDAGRQVEGQKLRVILDKDQREQGRFEIEA